MLLVNLDTEDRLNLWAECETVWDVDPDTNALTDLFEVVDVSLFVKFEQSPKEEWLSLPERVSDLWKGLAVDACKDEQEQAQELHGPVVVELVTARAAGMV